MVITGDRAYLNDSPIFLPFIFYIPLNMPTISPAASLKAKYEAQRINRLLNYGIEIRKLYFDAIDNAAKAAYNVQLKPGVFYIEKYPELNQRVNNVLNQLSDKIEAYLYSTITQEWMQADIDNDALFNQLLNPTGKKRLLLNGRNDDALQSFLHRVDDNGLNLSKRVFNYVGQFKQELEAGLGDGIAYGKSAAVMAADLKQYLLRPDDLFRRVKKNGKLKLSKAALNYKPGQGVYRSSYKNVFRLTRTENNMSYRSADHARYQQAAFVIGFEVKLSNRHPTYDMCDILKGFYPKTFKWVGWHSQCLCYNIPILLTPEEYDQMENDLLAGKDITKIKYSNRPEPDASQVREWYLKEKDKVDNWKSKPYFIRDNPEFFRT